MEKLNLSNQVDDALLFRFFRGETTTDEEKMIDKWLEADPERHGKQYRSAIFIYEASVMHGGKPKPQMVPLRRIVRWASGAAAAILIAGGVGFVAQWQHYARQTTTIEAPVGQHIRFALADGTKINLNAGGRITYPSVFAGRERRVKLSGEAIFDVDANAKKPFVVETFAAEVRVLGTRFDVIADEEDDRFSTALFDGRVSINRLDGSQQMELEPNMVVSLRGGQWTKGHINDMDAYLWPEGIISVGGLSFDELVEKLENAYGVRIVSRCAIPPTIYYTNLKVRVSDGIEHAMGILSDASDFSYEYDSSKNIVTIK